MDRHEAAALLRQELAGYAARSHAQLARLIGAVDAYEVRGPSGTRYQVEVQAYWEGKTGGTIRVLAGIDDGSLRGAFRPVSDGFLKEPPPGDAQGMIEPEGPDRSREARARELLWGFAERTGLTGRGHPRRYLWTDAFAVCSLLEIGERELALRLVDQVHRVLGHHRDDDPRAGWISGLDDEEGERHPTIAGLRIGKPRPERRADGPLDEGLEWDRDGQYFHYLTRWMHALDQVARTTGQPAFHLWARELAVAAHRAFTYPVPTRAGSRTLGMYWKVSIDLSRPLVRSMGLHDPLDGYITCLQLAATASRLRTPEPGPDLEEAAADFAAMIPTDLATPDPLGIGGLLADAGRLSQVADPAPEARDLLDRLLAAALEGLVTYARGKELREPASRRLAFRELGLAIGLAALPLLTSTLDRGSIDPRLATFTELGPRIVAFWLEPEHQRTSIWVEHQDINEVMLAASLVPDGYLKLA